MFKVTQLEFFKTITVDKMKIEGTKELRRTIKKERGN